jgi:hypothetical protein
MGSIVGHGLFGNRRGQSSTLVEVVRGRVRWLVGLLAEGVVVAVVLTRPLGITRPRLRPKHPRHRGALVALLGIPVSGCFSL